MDTMPQSLHSFEVITPLSFCPDKQLGVVRPVHRLNGGPGCSSLFGYIKELGPFTYSPVGDSLLFNNVNATPNTNAWNQVGPSSQF